MEAWITVLVLAAVVVPIASIVGAVLAIGLNRRVRRIEMRIGERDAGRGDAWPNASPASKRASATWKHLGRRLASRRAIAVRVAAAPPVRYRPSRPSIRRTKSHRQLCSPHLRLRPRRLPPSAATCDCRPSPLPERPGLEERFGTRWVVWVGGLALALGGVFMVRYSIEQGWIGPGVRVALGALLAAAWSAPANGCGGASTG